MNLEQTSGESGIPAVYLVLGYVNTSMWLAESQDFKPPYPQATE